MKIKKLLERKWSWCRGSQEQKDLYVIIEQEKRITELEREIAFIY